MHAVAADDDRLLRSIPAARVALIERIGRAPAARRPTALLQRFLRSYFHGVAEEDLAAREPRQLAKAALAHLEFATRRAPAARWCGYSTRTRERGRLREPAYAGAHGHRRHALPGGLARHGLRPRRPRRAPHRAPGAAGAARSPRRDCSISAQRRAGRARRNRGSCTRSTASPMPSTARSKLQQRSRGHARRRARSQCATGADARRACARSSARLESDPPPLPAAEVSEARHLLDWMEAPAFRIPRLSPLSTWSAAARRTGWCRSAARDWASSAPAAACGQRARHRAAWGRARARRASLSCWSSPRPTPPPRCIAAS